MSKFFKSLILVIICGLSILGIGYWIYNEIYYSPTKLETAIEEFNFSRVHKILNRMANDPEYTYEGLIFKEESQYSKACRRAMTWEILYLVKDGAVERIHEVSSLYHNGDVLLPEIMKNQASAVFKNLTNYTLDDLVMLSKYYSIVPLTHKAIALRPSNSELIDFLRRAQIDAPSAVTGNVRKKEYVEHNQYVNNQINQYNEACDIVLKYGLENGDKMLCSSLLSLYRDNLIIELKKTHTFSSDEYDVYYYPLSRERAANLINQMQ